MAWLQAQECEHPVNDASRIARQLFGELDMHVRMRNVPKIPREDTTILTLDQV